MTERILIQAAVRQGAWSGPALDTIVLTFDDRYRRRVVLETEAGRIVQLDFAEARVLRGGDALRTEGGDLIEVVAADEELLEVLPSAKLSLPRLCWHLGNRHVSAEIADDRVRIRYDHVLAEMLTQLGAEVRKWLGPFEPEGGAYGRGTHGHSHSHGHSH